MDGGWNWVFGGLETFLDLFVIFRSKVDVPLIETSFVHNALTRRIDPRHPEGPWIFFSDGSQFWDLQFFRSWVQGPMALAQGPKSEKYKMAKSTPEAQKMKNTKNAVLTI